jgi:hypothetical protein
MDMPRILKVLTDRLHLVLHQIMVVMMGIMDSRVGFLNHRVLILSEGFHDDGEEKR